VKSITTHSCVNSSKYKVAVVTTLDVGHCSRVQGCSISLGLEVILMPRSFHHHHHNVYLYGTVKQIKGIRTVERNKVEE